MNGCQTAIAKAGVTPDEFSLTNPYTLTCPVFRSERDAELTKKLVRGVPLYEAKRNHQFDHRWATYTADVDGRDVSDAEEGDPDYAVTPPHWVSAAEVEERLTKPDREGNVIWQQEKKRGTELVCSPDMVVLKRPHAACPRYTHFHLPIFDAHGRALTLTVSDFACQPWISAPSS